MRSVMFNFAPQVPAQQQEEVLRQIGAWDSISKTARLSPGARHPDVLRMGYAYVEDDADIDSVVQRLSALPEIESAHVPAERRLL